MRFHSLFSRRAIAAVGLFAITLAGLARTPAAAANPEVGFTQMVAHKYPSYGCPAKVVVFLQTAIRNWPDGDTTTHKVTYVLWRMKTNGSIVKYKPVDADFIPDTSRPENHWTTYDSENAELNFGFNVTQSGAIDKYKLFITKPFHHESEWMEVPIGCP